jgi:hypothetical protein
LFVADGERRAMGQGSERWGHWGIGVIGGMMGLLDVIGSALPMAQFKASFTFFF